MRMKFVGVNELHNFLANRDSKLLRQNIEEQTMLQANVAQFKKMSLNKRRNFVSLTNLNCGVYITI